MYMYIQATGIRASTLVSTFASCIMGRGKLGENKQRAKQKWKKRQRLSNSSQEVGEHEWHHQCAESTSIASDDTFGSPTSALAELENLGLLNNDTESEGETLSGSTSYSGFEGLNSHLQGGLLRCMLRIHSSRGKSSS